MNKAKIEALIRNARRLLRREKRCPHHQCEHRAEQHVRKGSACAIRGCTCPDIGAIVYEVDVTLAITYLRPGEVHDEGFYHMLFDILQRAEKGYRKYKFELKSMNRIDTVRTIRKRDVKK